MSKLDFAAGLTKLRTPERPPEDERALPSPAPAKAYPEPPSRVGKVAISAYFDPAVRQQLAIMAARQNKSQAALMAEALNMLFAQYGESQIAKA